MLYFIRLIHIVYKLYEIYIEWHEDEQNIDC